MQGREPMSTVHFEVDEAVATITIDAPERRNALTAQLLSDLRTHLDTAESDRTVRTVVLTHTGPVFSSGMDLTNVADVAPSDQPINAFPALLLRVRDFPKPVIARVAGRARAGGVGLIAACDITIAVPSADFAISEVRMGLVPAVISVPVLARVQLAAAAELFLTGETFDAERARSIGLINIVAPDLDAEVARYTAMYRLCEPRALAATKELLRRDRSSLTVSADLAAMSALSAEFFSSPQAAEGIAAFRAKRNPRWAE